ncbi:zinc finger, PHD-type containing protein, partial [Tanacetum coccineum]
ILHKSRHTAKDMIWHATGKCTEPGKMQHPVDGGAWKNIDVYLRPLIEDLQVLWDKKGVETIDIVSGQNFNMRAMVLWTINDFPARSSLSGWSRQGYKACPTCNEETPSIGVKNKIAYVGHRRFLRKPHKWRSSREFNGDTD